MIKHVLKLNFYQKAKQNLFSFFEACGILKEIVNKSFGCIHYSFPCPVTDRGGSSPNLKGDTLEIGSKRCIQENFLVCLLNNALVYMFPRI